MKGEQLRAALCDESMLCWPAPDNATFAAERALPSHTSV